MHTYTLGYRKSKGESRGYLCIGSSRLSNAEKWHQRIAHQQTAIWEARERGRSRLY